MILLVLCSSLPWLNYSFWGWNSSRVQSDHLVCGPKPDFIKWNSSGRRYLSDAPQTDNVSFRIFEFMSPDWSFKFLIAKSGVLTDRRSSRLVTLCNRKSWISRQGVSSLLHSQEATNKKSQLIKKPARYSRLTTANLFHYHPSNRSSLWDLFIFVSAHHIFLLAVPRWVAVCSPLFMFN